MTAGEAQAADRRLAVWAETLYLVNLMLAPGLAFLVLAVLYFRARRVGPLARNHLSQAFGVSLLGGGLLVAVVALLVAFGDLSSGTLWMWVVLYFTFIHSTLILLGVLGLVKAMNGEHFVYPLLGRPFAP
ncbi:MAG: hypothetical protein D6721_06930 [Gammaproteobacteria bacterium]|nr:MAG: hypothetical protein D6721_06930 [Gammaproteobacteria bacterium]